MIANGMVPYVAFGAIVLHTLRSHGVLPGFPGSRKKKVSPVAVIPLKEQSDIEEQSTAATDTPHSADPLENKDTKKERRAPAPLPAKGSSAGCCAFFRASFLQPYMHACSLALSTTRSPHSFTNPSAVIELIAKPKIKLAPPESKVKAEVKATNIKVAGPEAKMRMKRS